MRLAGEADEAPPTVLKSEPERVLLHMPVDVRSASLAVIAVLMGLFALHWARAVFVPLLLSVMFTYALAPVVDALCRWRLPRALSAAVLMLGLVSAIGAGAYTLQDDVDNLIKSMPDAARALRKAVRGQHVQADSNMDKVQKAADQLQLAAAQLSQASNTGGRGITRVQIEKPAFNINDYLVVGTLSIVEMIGQLTAVCFITYFMLASGDIFRRKLAHIAGPNFAKRKITVQALNEITQQVRRYLVVQIVTSIGVGVATSLVFWALGMNHVAVWGIVAGVLNLIPYLGSIAVCALSAIAALTQFGSLDKALLVASVSVILHVISGYMIAPWLTSRTSRLNTVVVFVGMLAWGWLWGVWGLLLGTPIMMAIKAVCDRVDELKAVGELMGGVEGSKESAAVVNVP
ncbi:MAG: AI-2E family transporter [Rubrivivax sp.]|nr:MAG: AI-2E family transporter [Rubrivivax sp.]